MCTSSPSHRCSGAFSLCTYIHDYTHEKHPSAPCLTPDVVLLHSNTLGHKIVGYPVRIDSQRYARNAYYFNLCFVCDSWARTVQYEPVVKKLAEYFVSKAKRSATSTPLHSN